MSTKLQALRERRNAQALAAQDLSKKFPADQRMPADEAGRLDALLNEVEAIDAEIAREKRIADAAGVNLSPAAEHEIALNAAIKRPSEHGPEAAALRNFLTGGLNALTTEQRSAMAARLNPDIRAAMSTTVGAEGGFTVSPEYHRQLLEAQKAFGGMRAVASNIRTSTGAQMLFVTSDATAEEGEILGQNAAATLGETTFGQASIDVFKYSSKKIGLPFELIQDSMFDIEAYVQKLLALRLARIQNKHFTNGTGTGQPKGIITAATVGKAGATGSTTSVSYDDLVDLEHSVDPAYRSNAGVGFMMADSTLKALRKLKDSQGRPIFVPGYEQGNPGGAPDRLLGRPIYVNQDVPAMAASAKSILFGDFSKYVVRDVQDTTIFRMADSGFVLNGQIGFIAFSRSGGNLPDVGGAVKVYQNSAT